MVQGGWGFASGTFGELVQGEIDDTPFLVTLPIRWGTRATFIPRSAPGVDVYPSHRKKAQKAAQLALIQMAYDGGGLLSISSVIPIGKGMASSSADIVASMRAVWAAMGKEVAPKRMARLAARIEPSDGVMYDGVVVFNPRQGTVIERWNMMPFGLIVGLVGRGRVNTEAHHRERKSYDDDHQKKLAAALDNARRGVQERDFALLGQAGRLSAEVQADRDPEDYALRLLLKESEARDWGVVIAHSGTVRGFLFSPQMVRRGYANEAERILRRIDKGAVFRFWTQSRPLVHSGIVALDHLMERQEQF